MPTPPPTRPKPRSGAPPILIGIGIAVGGMLLVLVLSALAGYGRDIHLVRAIALCGVLFAASAVAFQRSVKQPLRGLLVAAGVVGGLAAWLLVPCRASGPSFASAIASYDRMAIRMSLDPELAVERLKGVVAELDTLADDFPSLADGLRPSVHRFAEVEKLAIEMGFSFLGASDPERLAELRDRSDALAKAVPEHKQALDDTFTTWARDVVPKHTQWVRDLGSDATEDFNRTALLRKVLAATHAPTRGELVVAEGDWVGRWAKAERTALVADQPDPGVTRQRCVAVEGRLMQLPSLDETPTRFAAIRREFFTLAHESARAEVAALHKQERFDRALGIALAHQFEWTKLPGVVGPAEQKLLDELRERCRALCRPGGDPDPVPPPRPIETAPPPRAQK